MEKEKGAVQQTSREQRVDKLLSRKKMSIACAEKVSGSVLVVLQSALPDWTCSFVFQSSPCELVLEVCWVHCSTISVLINGVPIFRFRASPWSCLLHMGAHGTSCTVVTSTFAGLLASVSARSSCRHHLLPSLLSWTITGAFPLASGNAEGFLGNVLALSHENTTVRDKDKQRAGYQKVM